MIKRIKFIGVLILFCILLTSCSSIVSINNVVSPKQKSSPIEGKWIAIKCLTLDHQECKINDEDSQLQFTKHVAIIGKNIYTCSKYSIKRVNSDDYFMYKYHMSNKNLGISSNEIYVVTVSSSQNYINEFCKINNDELAVQIKDKLLIYKKCGNSSEDISKTAVNSPINNSNTTTTSEGNLKSGLLLGVRGSDDKFNNSDYYRTYWISSNDKQLHPILKTNTIFLPRKNGFWILDNTTGGLGSISVSNITNSTLTKQVSKTTNMKILFVSNDYTSVEITDSQNKHYLRLLPVDNINNEKGIKFSDIWGIDGISTLEKAYTTAISSLASSKTSINTNDKYENFKLYRKSGHWYVEGRINYTKDTENIDYDINVIPPEKLLVYDTLCLPWSVIKNRVPDAIDAFTSPNKDIAIVIESNKFQVFSITKGTLSYNPLAKEQLENGDSVIMAEWCTGNYTNNWENSFIRVMNK